MAGGGKGDGGEENGAGGGINPILPFPFQHCIESYLWSEGCTNRPWQPDFGKPSSNFTAKPNPILTFSSILLPTHTIEWKKKKKLYLTLTLYNLRWEKTDPVEILRFLHYYAKTPIRTNRL